jgi:NADPH-dependent 2,4-dienoyl-CoA reductase/sulfur reductase-like enzyme/Fe-S-cluster-containing hydrogenase component 2
MAVTSEAAGSARAAGSGAEAGIDVAVVGGGPAGLAAAIEAARHGASVTVFDEQAAPGGQLFKQIHKFFGSREHRAGTRGYNIGRELLEEAAALGVDIRLGATVYAVYPGPELAVAVGGEARRFAARRLVVATGASENALAFPGWTLPGVMGAGAAQTLVNVHRVLPGRRVLMVGSGNVGLIVSYQLLQAGADVAAVVEALPRLGGYQVHAAKLRRAGVPILLGHTILGASGRGRVERARIGRIGPEGTAVPGSERELEVDTVCLAVGLSPLTELLGILGVSLTYIPELGGHVPLHDQNMRTSIPEVYVAGDVTGVEEASSAMEEGRLAGIAVAESLGLVGREEADRLKDAVRGRLDALRRGPFGAARREAKARQVGRGAAGPADLLPPDEGQDPGRAPLPGPVFPSPVRLARGPVAVIDCPQEIPCNPCEAACPKGAIKVGQPITGLPVLDEEACTGCGLCLTACPGLAIFLVDGRGGQGRVSFPHEYLPLPEKGRKVTAVDADGQPVCQAEVVGVRLTREADRTPVVTVRVPVEQVTRVRGLRRER